jgi:hypothetical protein
MMRRKSRSFGSRPGAGAGEAAAGLGGTVGVVTIGFLRGAIGSRRLGPKRWERPGRATADAMVGIAPDHPRTDYCWTIPSWPSTPSVFAATG